jgi:tRNA(Ile2)-agmatinylcytidine synthase
VDLIGEPRLVRLNPNVPYKTRGNAALSARFGRGRGAPREIGRIDDRPVYAFSSGRPLTSQRIQEFSEEAWRVVRAGSQLEEEETDPAMVVSPRPLPSRLYWAAVRSHVDFGTAQAFLDRSGASIWCERSRRGLVGAAAAIAWPSRNVTWELIAYRQKSRLGSPRTVDSKSVRRVQERFPELFLCYDKRTRRLMVAPHTICPILYGLRATRPENLARARRLVRSEPVDR